MYKLSLNPMHPNQKNTFFQKFLILFLLSFIVLWSACEKQNSAPLNQISVNDIRITPQSLSIAIGATATLEAIVLPDHASNKTVNWRSSDPSKATVDANGVVTGVSEGKVNVTATTADGGKTAVVNITVINLNFVSVWNVTDGKITLPLVNNGNYNFTVDWGDGKKDDIKTWDDAKKTHTYQVNNQSYTVTISGKIEGWAFKMINAADPVYSAKSFTEVKNWGTLSLGDTNLQFFGCENLNFTATDSPDLSKTTSLEGAFALATHFNSNIEHWDVSRITKMGLLFTRAKAFNQPLNNWNVSKVVDMQGTFADSDFNQPLDKWDVSQVTRMEATFALCNFNQPLDKWNVSRVTNMETMFYQNKSFNQNISGWDISNVTNHTNFSEEGALTDANKPKFK